MADNIGMVFGAVDQASSDIGLSTGTIRNHLDDIIADLNRHRDNWTGSASEAFTATQTQWNQTLEEMAALLRDVGVATGHAGTDGKSVEDFNTGLWR